MSAVRATNLYKKFGVGILLLSLIVQTFQNELVWVDYLLNTQAYEILCENKSRPEIKCKGQCQMSKKIEQAEEQNKQTPTLQFKTVDILLYKQNDFKLTPVIFPVADKQYLELLVLKTTDYYSDLFRPPTTA